MSINEISWENNPNINFDLEAVIQFHLTYSGPLFSSGNDSCEGKSDHKHDIRLALHPQLKRLWKTSPALNGPKQKTGELQWTTGIDRPPSMAISARADRFKIKPWCFVPLITKNMHFHCGIDVLVLHNEPIKPIQERGDLDGRLKTLFDALAVPDANQGYSDRTFPKHHNPLFVLLQDDRQITKVSVNTSTLLEPLDSDKPDKFDPNDVRLLIRVKLAPSEPATWNLRFL